MTATCYGWCKDGEETYFSGRCPSQTFIDKLRGEGWRFFKFTVELPIVRGVEKVNPTACEEVT
jgi:hypothetical protein